MGAGAVLALALVLRVRRRRRRRRQEYAELAKRRRLNYARIDLLDLPKRYRVFTLCRRGHNRRASHVVSGAMSQGAVSCFRYNYETGSGAGRAVRTWGIAVLEADLEFPPLSIVPSGETEGTVGIETRGRLIAVYSPGRVDAPDFDRLIQVACDAAGRLGPAAEVPAPVGDRRAECEPAPPVPG